MISIVNDGNPAMMETEEYYSAIRSNILDTIESMENKMYMNILVNMFSQLNDKKVPDILIEEVAKTGDYDIMDVILKCGIKPDDNRSIEYARDNGHYYMEQVLIAYLTPSSL